MEEATLNRLYQQYLVSHCVTTDSRRITPGCIFFALKGANFDGNTFAAQALEQGAALCVVDNKDYATDERCILVDDVLKALQELALHHRLQLTIPVIGITGTNGKTTTKELVNAVLSKRYRTHATQGNFNNHLGVPLTLLSIPADTEIAIVEMGANHPGEIEQLCAIAQPTFGLITNVGKAHLEGFGSFEGVVHTKTELYRFLAANKGTLFVDADNPILTAEAEKLATIPEVESMLPGYIPGMPIFDPSLVEFPLTVITYGASEEAQVRGTYVGSEPYMKFYLQEDDNVYTIQTHLLGGYNFGNAMAAVCAGQYFNVDTFSIKEALEEYEPSNNRSQYKRTAANALILDCYNANPSSMKVALDNFDAMQQPHKVAMLGAMRELGRESEKEHLTIADRLKEMRLDQVILVGSEFAFADGTEGFCVFADVEQAKAYLKAHPISGATVLIKGSNSTQMWKLEEEL